MIRDYEQFTKKYEQKILDEQNFRNDQESKEHELKSQGQMIARMNSDLVYFTKVFNVDTLKKIN